MRAHSTIDNRHSTLVRVTADSDLQSLCELGQRELVLTHYLQAERALMRAESRAWLARDWDTLSRLYMPLQEARRQRRQRCGEGVVKLDLISVDSRAPAPTAGDIVDRYPHGQLLVAAPGSIELSLSVRRLAWERELYVETFLAATYNVANSFVVVIVPTADVALPPNDGRPLDRLISTLPAFSIVLTEAELVRGERRGTDESYAQTMALWERLHAPFLAAARTTTDRIQQMAGLRRTIEVDYASEIAHQELSKIAGHLKRSASSLAPVLRGEG